MAVNFPPRSPIVASLLRQSVRPLPPVHSVGEGFARAGSKILAAVLANKLEKRARDERNEDIGKLADVLLGKEVDVSIPISNDVQTSPSPVAGATVPRSLLENGIRAPRVGGVLGDQPPGVRDTISNLLTSDSPIGQEMGLNLAAGALASSPPNTFRELTPEEEAKMFGEDKPGTFGAQFRQDGTLAGLPQRIEGTAPKAPNFKEVTINGQTRIVDVNTPEGKRLVNTPGATFRDTRQKPPSGFRADEQGNLVPIPGGPGEMQASRLDLSVTNNIAARVAELYGAKYDPLNGLIVGLEGDVAGEALKVQARAAELLEQREANNVPAAVLKAQQEVLGGGEALVSQAEAAVSQGADPDQVAARLKERGVSQELIDEFLKRTKNAR